MIDLSAFAGEPPDDSDAKGPAEIIELSALLPEHLRHLQETSGLTEAIIKARGYSSVMRKADLKKLGFSDSQQLVPALVIPLYGLDGEIVTHQIRPDQPRLRDNKPIKYETPKGSAMRMDISPLIRKQLDDHRTPLWITEGIKKVDSAILHGLCCIGLLGVANWRGRNENGSSIPLAEWHSIPLKGRRVFISYDSDTASKPEVQTEAIKLQDFLEHKGAEVFHATPPTPDGRKMGLDDYFVSGGTVGDLIAGASRTIRKTLKPSDLILDATQNTGDGPPKFPFTDLGNAERMVHYYGQDLRYCAAFKSWLFWNGAKWSIDEKGDAMAQNCAQRTARDIQREALTISDEEKRKKMFVWGVQCEGARTLNNMVSIAKTLPGIPITTGDLDSHKDLLNLANGTFDLVTGKLREHRREDLLTCCIDASYRPVEEADCPQWIKFLYRAFKSDEEMIRFIWKSVGYSLCGSVGEKCFFFLYGSGDNGKSVFVEALVRILGDYARSAKADTFALKPIMGGNAANADIARLREARFVATSETQDGSRLNEALVKDLTGGDKIVARFNYQNEFEFKPQFKIWMFGNHKPQIKDAGDAMWRRVILINFDVVIPKEEQDQDLGEKLYSERDGIISWAIDGCMMWRKEKLGRPTTITQAVQEYRKDSDVLGAFLDECTKVVSGVTVMARAMYQRYVAWSKATGQRAMTETAFGRAMKERGELKGQNMYGAIYRDRELVKAENEPNVYRGGE